MCKELMDIYDRREISKFQSDVKMPQELEQPRTIYNVLLPKFDKLWYLTAHIFEIFF